MGNHDGIRRTVDYLRWMEKKGGAEAAKVGWRVLFHLSWYRCPKCKGDTTYRMSATAHESGGTVPCNHCRQIGAVEGE